MSLTITRVDNGAQLGFDAVTLMNATFSVGVTEHPIEEGAAVTDHTQKLPDNLAVQAIISETPAQARPGLPIENRIEAARDFLTQSAGLELTLESPRFGQRTPYVLTTYTEPITIERGARFSLTFREIRRASFSIVTIPPTIGAAIRCMTSEPVPVPSMIGNKPTMVDVAVIATGRTRLDVPAWTASMISCFESVGLSVSPRR